jgi:hypothetical protein
VSFPQERYNSSEAVAKKEIPGHVKIKVRPLDYVREVLGPTLRAASFWMTLLGTLLIGNIIVFFISETWLKFHYLVIPLELDLCFCVV